MRQTLLKAVILGLALGGTASGYAAAPAKPQGKITVREYSNIGGTAIGDLTGAKAYPDSPDVVSYPTRLEWPTGADDATPPAGDIKNNYGWTITGYIYPPKTADYIFALAADDNADVWLSTDETPANAVRICNESQWNPVRMFGADTRRTQLDVGLPTERWENVSKKIRLEVGKAYYIQARAKEGGGGDNLAVAWTSDGTLPADGDLPISGAFLSTIDRGDLTIPYLAGITADPTAVQVSLNDGEGTGAKTVDAASVKVTLDGVDSKGTSAKSGAVTTVTVAVSPFFAPGSTHTVSVNFAGASAPIVKTLTIDNYKTLPASAKVSGVDTSKPGFSVFTHQVSTGQENTNDRTEKQLAGLLKDADGVALPNIADLTGAKENGRFAVPGVINMSQAEGETNGNFVPDEAMPGIPGNEGGTDNIAMEILTYIELPKGWVVMGVNSDDGFLTSSGLVKDVLARLDLGAFSGGRGAADTIFGFAVEEAGFYPFRTTWEEGGGGANIEWFSVSGGKKILINDVANGGLKAFRAAAAGAEVAVVTSLSPKPGETGYPNPAPIQVQITDGSAAISDAKLKYDGADVAATVTKAGKVTTLKFTTAAMAGNSKHKVSLSYVDSGKTVTRDWEFTVTPFDKDTLFVEAEDFDFDGGKTIENKKIGMDGPYLGGDFDGLGTDADVGIDYFNPGGNAGQAYRPGTGVAAGKGPVGSGGSERYTFQVEKNWTVGWNDPGDWQNYTRTFPTPAKKYNVWGHLSSGGNAINGQLDRVTKGVGTTAQTIEYMATVAPGRATAGWDNLEVFQFTDTSKNNAPVVVEIGGKITFRFTTLPGANLDIDWFAFTAATDVAKPAPKFTSVTLKGTEVTVTWDGGGTLQAATSVTGPWVDVTGATSPYKTTANQGSIFARIKQ